MIKLPENNFTRTLYPALILLLTFVLYYRVGDFGFMSVWDDNLNVLNNPYIRNLSFESIRTIFSADTPISEPRFTLLTFAIDYKLWQLDPRMYHLENMMLHLLNVTLVFLLAFRLVKKLNISALVAALFAFHPFRLESVAWVSGRKDLLFAFFFLLAMLFYLEYLRKEKLWWLLLVLGVSWLSFQSKIQAVTLPLTLLMLDVMLRKKLSVMRLLEKFLIASVVLFNYFHLADVMALLMLWLMWRLRDSYLPRLKFVQRFISDPGKGLLKMLLQNALLWLVFWFVYSLLFRAVLSQFMPVSYNLILLLSAAWVAWFSLEDGIERWKTEMPLGLFIRKYHVWIVLAVIGAMAVLAFGLYGIRLHLWNDAFSAQFSFGERWLMAGYSLFWYLVYAVFPLQLSSLRPYPDFEAAHLPQSYYVLSVFALIILAAFAWWLFRTKHNKRLKVFCLLFFGVNIFLVLHIIPIEGRVIMAERYTYLAYFGLFLLLGMLLNSLKLVVSNIKLHLGMIAGVLLCGLFWWLSYRGLDAWKDEVALLDEQVSRNPEYPMAYLNRSTLYINRGEPVKAIADLDKAIALDAKFYQAYYNRALAFSRMNIFDKAADDCSQALRLAPAFADAHYLRAFSFNKLQQYTQAIAGYSQAIALNPRMYLAYYNRGNARLSCGEYQAALADYDSTLLLQPVFADAYSSRGVVLYFTGGYRASLADYAKAIALNPQNGNYFYNRALSYKALSESDKFCADLQTALNLGYEPAAKVMEEQCP